MIRSVLIQDFQSHEDTLLKLDKGVNVICGSSDSGKTAILRALEWALFNRPAGDSFRRRGVKTSTMVEVGFDDRVWVERSKGSNTNNYQLSIPDPDNPAGIIKTELTAFGQGVPEEVAKAANVSGLNIQGQHDSPYLLSESAGEVARRLNEIVNLDSIDRALSNIDRRARDNSQELARQEALCGVLEEELKRFAYLKDMEEDVAELEGLEASLKKQEDGIDKVNDLLTKQRAQQDILDRAGRLPDMDEINALLEAGRKLKERKVSYFTMASKIDALQNWKGDLRRTTEELEQEEKEFHELMPSTCPLCGQEVK